MSNDRIVELRIAGLRSLVDVRLELDGLTVLIGENGTGKSSILEAWEILRRATRPTFMDELYAVHGGLADLQSREAPLLDLGITVRGPGDRLSYRLALIRDGSLTTIHTECLRLESPRGRPRRIGIIERSTSSAKVYDERRKDVLAQVPPAGRTLLSIFAERPPHPAIARMVQVLAGIDIHLPFEVRAGWASREFSRSTARDANDVRPLAALPRYGLQLSNAYQQLKNRPARQWQETLEDVRLGLGQDVEDVVIQTMPEGSRVALAVKYRALAEPVSMRMLADGALAYLAFVALFKLTTHRTLLAFDEPETHLHPNLLARVLDHFEAASHQYPVVLATHSDRLLDALSDPVASVVACDTGDDGTTRLRRLDARRLESWLRRYRGVGEIRSAGHERSILGPAERPT